MSRIRIAYFKEPADAYGMVPGTIASNTDPVFKRVRMTGENLTITPEVISSNEIRDDRQKPDTIVIGKTTGGTVNVEWTAKNLDDFLSAAMCEDWTANVLQTGTKDFSFSILKSYVDLDKHILLLGQRISSMQAQYTFKQILTGTVTFVGADYRIYQNTAALNAMLGGGTIEDSEQTDVLNASDDVKRLLLDGNPSDVCFRSIQLGWNNGHRAQECIARRTPKDQIKQDNDVNGAIELFFTGNAWGLFEDSLDQTPFELALESADSAGNSYFFEMPRAKINAPAPSIGGRNQDLLLSGNWSATVDQVSGFDIRCTRAIV